MTFFLCHFAVHQLMPATLKAIHQQFCCAPHHESESNQDQLFLVCGVGKQDQLLLVCGAGNEAGA
jgi:hypothetical protein